MTYFEKARKQFSGQDTENGGDAEEVMEAHGTFLAQWIKKRGRIFDSLIDREHLSANVKNHPGVQLQRSLPMRRAILLLSTALLALSLTACIRRHVTSAELPGRWSLTLESNVKLTGQIRRSNALTLNEDGTFEVRDLPGKIWAQNGLISGNGHWTFKEEDQSLVLVLSQLDGTQHHVPYGTELDVYGTRRAVTLRYFLGDPDDGNTFDFKK